VPVTTEELLGGTLELLLCVKLDEDTAEELEATEELLEATEELLISMLELLETPTLDDELLDEETSKELELNSTNDELLDDKNPSELELNPTSEELLEISTLDEETPSELELDSSAGEELLYLSFKGGGGISRSDEQEISSEVQSTAARGIGQGKNFFIICSPF